MNGRMADAFGFVHIALQARSPDFIHHMGGSINSDGTWFVLPEPSGKGVDLFMRQIDGSAEPIRLTSSGLQNGAINRSPEISPDDSSIAFIHESGGNKQVDLAFYDIAREIEVILTSDALREADPSWSPDGNQLVFSRYDTAESSGLRFGEIPNHNLYTINLSAAVAPDPDPDPDPDQNGSAPLTIHRAIELEFQVEETRNYILQYSHDLTNWQDYQFISNQSPGPMSIFVRQSKETQFWRLLYQAP
jgi:dipeptidyl aminopeptidase/acylaminoacyl peptidase